MQSYTESVDVRCLRWTRWPLIKKKTQPAFTWAIRNLQKMHNLFVVRNFCSLSGASTNLPECIIMYISIEPISCVWEVIVHIPIQQSHHPPLPFPLRYWCPLINSLSIQKTTRACSGRMDYLPVPASAACPKGCTYVKFITNCAYPFKEFPNSSVSID